MMGVGWCWAFDGGGIMNYLASYYVRVACSSIVVVVDTRVEVGR